MPISTTIIKSQPGIKRDGTQFDGNNYTDGQWCRFQRGMPRKIGGFRSINKYLTEISRGISAWAQHNLQYMHSGSASLLERFTIDENGNTSIISNRTPGAFATGTLTLTGGGAGSVNTVSVNGVTITSGAVAFNTNLTVTAAAVAANIVAYTSVPDYTATAAGPVITISSAIKGAAPNGFVVAATTTTITTSVTPMAGGEEPLQASVDNIWMFDYQYAPSDTENFVLAHVAPNGSCSCNDEGGQIFFGDVLTTDRLLEIPLPANMNATGGIVVLHPYLVYYGSDGMVGWSVPGTPYDLTGSGSGQARPWSQKFIKGLPIRAGAGNGPAGILWAYDAVVRMTWVGGAEVFNFDVMMTQTSIMSPQSVIDYDGVFYWPSVDRFLLFNGVVREIENTLNINYFFDGLKAINRSKVFAFKVPRFGEIWWAYPKGDATECTHAVIYNVRENTWYDTALPNHGRSAGAYNSELLAPVLTGVEASSDGFKVWLHERGTDQIDGDLSTSIESFFITADFSLPATQGIDAKLRITTFEPDFVQNGPMTIQVLGRANARAPEEISDPISFPDIPTEQWEQIVALKVQRRQMRLKLSSNVPGGNYQMGQLIGHMESGDHQKIS